MNNFQIWIPVIASSAAAIIVAVNAWALEFWKKNTKDAPKQTAQTVNIDKERKQRRRMFHLFAFLLFLEGNSIINLALVWKYPSANNIKETLNIAANVSAMMFYFVSVMVIFILQTLRDIRLRTDALYHSIETPEPKQESEINVLKPKSIKRPKSKRN